MIEINKGANMIDITNTTVQELRQILFHVDNQELTIKQLRDFLFDERDQCETLESFFIYLEKQF